MVVSRILKVALQCFYLNGWQLNSGIGFWNDILTTNFCPEASKVSLRLSLVVGLCQETLGSRLMFFYRLQHGWPWPAGVSYLLNTTILIPFFGRRVMLGVGTTA